MHFLKGLTKPFLTIPAHGCGWLLSLHGLSFPFFFRRLLFGPSQLPGTMTSADFLQFSLTSLYEFWGYHGFMAFPALQDLPG